MGLILITIITHIFEQKKRFMVLFCVLYTYVLKINDLKKNV